MTLRLNVGYVGPQWATLFANPALGDHLSGRNIAGAQLAWQHARFVTTLYGTNLTDQHYVGALNSGLRFAGPPRQYGLRYDRTLTATQRPRLVEAAAIFTPRVLSLRMQSFADW